ncbi:hypothetical protein [Clavibacter michiganensis]|uniref:hypothetical protein n=1 Tax=Clavibacter michiganensis TaxID=28447 RepID=UPI00292CA7C7|nr:hypothetical protein [Clavibacter michiganensis]
MTQIMVIDLFTKADWARFMAARQEKAQEHGESFADAYEIDETAIFWSERARAAYLRLMMVAVGLDDLAMRINPADYSQDQDERRIKSHDGLAFGGFSPAHTG